MIKALLLVLDPAGGWDAIVLAKRGLPRILLGYLVPLWLIAFVAEGYGLVHWGKARGVISLVKQFSNSEALIFEILQLLLMGVIVFVGTKLIKALGETFHGRNTFTQAFTVTAYGLSPVFAMRILDMFPSVSSWVYWVVWGIGISLTFVLLYHGIPRVMLPDPPHAFGLYLTSCVFLAMVSGFMRFLSYWYLAGKFGKLDAFIANLVAHAPFLQSFNQIHF
jgi:Yip1-like protein